MVESEPESASAPSQSVLWMLAGTIIGGIAGYLVMWLTARAVGAAEYAVFGVFWSALFLLVGVLFGLQQEATRATVDQLANVRTVPRRASLWRFGAMAGIIVAVVVIVTSPLWAVASFGDGRAALAVQVAVGSGLSAVVAVASGVLAGNGWWRQLGVIIALDGLLRVGATAVVLSVSQDPSLLAWAVVSPYVILVIGIPLVGGRRLRTAGRVSLGYRRLAGHAAQTVLAASATAVLINGFPLVLALTAPEAPAATLGALIFAVTLTRAPLLVPLMALQSYLLTAFTLRRTETARLLLQWLAIVVVGAIVLALPTWLFGEWALGVVVGDDFRLPAGLLAALVIAAGCVGVLCVTGPAVLARGFHAVYAAGWLTASATSIVVLLLPLDLEVQVPLALAVGPILGVSVHLGRLIASIRGAARSAGRGVAR